MMGKRSTTQPLRLVLTDWRSCERRVIWFRSTRLIGSERKLRMAIDEHGQGTGLRKRGGGSAMAETKLQNRLKRLGACEEAVKWVADRDFAAAWTECQRADWMLWLCGWMAGKAGWPTREQIVLVCCRIAEDALPIYEEKYPNDKRVRECIEVTRRWAKGKATIEEVRKARDAARAAAATTA